MSSASFCLRLLNFRPTSIINFRPCNLIITLCNGFITWCFMTVICMINGWALSADFSKSKKLLWIYYKFFIHFDDLNCILTGNLVNLFQCTCFSLIVYPTINLKLYRIIFPILNLPCRQSASKHNRIISLTVTFLGELLVIFSWKFEPVVTVMRKIFSTCFFVRFAFEFQFGLSGYKKYHPNLLQ